MDVRWRCVNPPVGAGSRCFVLKQEPLALVFVTNHPGLLLRKMAKLRAESLYVCHAHAVGYHIGPTSNYWALLASLG